MSLFVSLEGIEGSGKSTLRTKLADLFPKSEREVVVTREPGATILGQQIRSLLLDPEIKDIDSLAELLLFNADRAQHLSKVVRPALDRGALVICDRYIHSTLAYQGYGRGIELEQLNFLNQFTTKGLTPDLVFLLDLDPEVGLSRARERAERSTTGAFSLAGRSEPDRESTGWSRFEEEELSFHNRVRDGFLALAKAAPEIFVKLDASRDASTVAEEAAVHLKRRLG